MEQLNIGLCGFGTVGSGVYKLLISNSDIIKRRTGIDFHIKKIVVKDINKRRDFLKEHHKEILTTDFNEIVNDKSIDIVVELIGGIDKAKDLIISALTHGKTVVTANKALLALYAKELIKIADENSAKIFFEASVAGGIPIIKVFKESLASNHLQYFYGILNGTSNYILSKMTEENLQFHEVLKTAQEKGYAEQDPTLDIEGIDAAHKLAILISLGYDVFVDFNEIYTEGISRVTADDIKFAEEFGYHIKLLAISKKREEFIEGRVHPALIKKNSILANINGVYNAILVKGDFLGPALFYGKGAGSYPTATSVVNDIMEAGKWCNNSFIFTSKYDEISQVHLQSIKNIKTKYYLRFGVVDKPGVLSKISGVLGEHNISIEAVIQKGRVIDNQKEHVPIVMITHECMEKDLISALEIIDRLDIIRENTFFIRIEDFNEEY